MQNTPSSEQSPNPKFPTNKEIQVLYPRLTEREGLLREATRILLAETMLGTKMDRNGVLQVYLNYCQSVQEKYPVYAEQAALAFQYISNHADHIDINDNHGNVRKLYPFLGPMITTIRGR